MDKFEDRNARQFLPQTWLTVSVVKATNLNLNNFSTLTLNPYVLIGL